MIHNQSTREALLSLSESAPQSTDNTGLNTLIYSFMAVEVRGQHLKDVRRAIQNGRCEFIQEYHENEFVNPTKDAPVIDSVKFITGEKLDDILSAYKGGK